MTGHKMFELIELYRKRLAPVATAGAVRLVDYDVEKPTGYREGGHLLWMLDEMSQLTSDGWAGKAMRMLGLVQHGLAALGLYSLAEIEEHSRNADEDKFPPPPGLSTVQAKCLLSFHCMRCGTAITRLGRQTWVPACTTMTGLAFPPLDANNRLEDIGGVGIDIFYRIGATVWDYTDQSFSLYLHAIDLHPYLTEESVALAVGLLREAGWTYADEEAKLWAARWELHHSADGCGYKVRKKKKKKKKRERDHAQDDKDQDEATDNPGADSPGP